MHLGFYGSNNGSVGFSVRQAAACLHSGQGRAKKALDELERLRFIECTRQSSFNVKTKTAREWRLTTQPIAKGAASEPRFLALALTRMPSSRSS